jgi:hypothetical protein
MIEKETARRLVLQFLAANPNFGQGTPDQVKDIETWVKQQGSLADADLPVIHEVIWDLIVQRVLTVCSKGPYDWGFVGLTDFGREAVKEQRWSPYDPDGYLKELQRQAPGLYSLCRMYAEESLRCFQGGCYLATVVMLGAASEAMVNELFTRFVEALEAAGVPEAASAKTKIEKGPSVFRKYEIFRRHFDPLVKPKLPGELGDDLNVQLDGVFNLIRHYRNEAGHPTGAQIERWGALRSLWLFVPYSRRIEGLINWMDAREHWNPKEMK